MNHLSIPASIGTAAAHTLAGITPDTRCARGPVMCPFLNPRYIRSTRTRYSSNIGWLLVAARTSTTAALGLPRPRPGLLQRRSPQRRDHTSGGTRVGSLLVVYVNAGYLRVP